MKASAAPFGKPVRTAVAALLLVVCGIVLRPYLFPAPESGRGPITLSQREIGFIQDMSAHHEQAVFLIDRLDPEVDPAVWRLGRQIEAAQRTEIGTMQGWLRLMNVAMTNPTPMSWMDPRPPTATSNDSATHHHATMMGAAAVMPGMATWAELTVLGDSRGTAAATLFLQLMVRHHQGGVDMARHFVQQQSSGPVSQQARAMIQDQGQEIGLMLTLLQQRRTEPLPYP